MICKHVTKLIWSSIPRLISLSILRHKPIWDQHCCIIVDLKFFQVVLKWDSFIWTYQMNFALHCLGLQMLGNVAPKICVTNWFALFVNDLLKIKTSYDLAKKCKHYNNKKWRHYNKHDLVVFYHAKLLFLY
jgi:hypothetical protein